MKEETKEEANCPCCDAEGWRITKSGEESDTTWVTEDYNCNCNCQ